jgi:hypothetical protein
MRGCTPALTGLALAGLALAGCERPVPDGEVATLYRQSVVGMERVHLATFDARDGRNFNWLNCSATAESLNARDDTLVPYWCEQGRFRP